MASAAIALLGGDLTFSLTALARNEVISAFAEVLDVSELVVSSILLSIVLNIVLDSMTSLERRLRKKGSYNIILLRWIQTAHTAVNTAQLLVTGISIQLSISLIQNSVTLPVARILTVFSAILVNVFLVKSASVSGQTLIGAPR